MDSETQTRNSGKARRIGLILLVAVVVAAVVAQRSRLAGPKPRAAATPSPAAAPGVKVKDLEGHDVTLEQFKGKVVLVNFWATWCEPCRIEIPWFVEFQEKYGPRGFTVLGVAMDDEGKSVVEPFVKKEEFDLDGRKVKINYPILLGNDALAEQLGGLIGLPTTVVISRDGKVVKRFLGLVSHDVVVRQIEALL